MALWPNLFDRRIGDGCLRPTPFGDSTFDMAGHTDSKIGIPSLLIESISLKGHLDY
jgi:hypothetical protein